MLLFPHGGIQGHAFALYALPHQITPLLPSVTQQQHGMGYWWEGSTSTAITPTSASDIVGQYNKIGGITSSAALILCGNVTANITNVEVLKVKDIAGTYSQVFIYSYTFHSIQAREY